MFLTSPYIPCRAWPIPEVPNMFQEQGICQRAFLHYGCCVPSSVYGRLLEWRQHGVKRRHGKYMDKYQMSTPNYERFKFPGVKSIDTYIHIYNYIYIYILITYIHIIYIYILCNIYTLQLCRALCTAAHLELTARRAPRSAIPIGPRIQKSNGLPAACGAYPSDCSSTIILQLQS